MVRANTGSKGRRRRVRPAPRVRRTGAEARRAILLAAERRLVRGGPEALRLQEIAADAGISHPAVLHHFGSREGLFAALVEHALARLEAGLIEIVHNRPPEAAADAAIRVERVARMLEAAHRVLAEHGQARVLAWLVLSRHDLGTLARKLLQGFPPALHQLRVQRRMDEGRPTPALEETLFGATMTMVTLLGDALFGPLVRDAIGLSGDAHTARRFRRWMAEVIERA